MRRHLNDRVIRVGRTAGPLFFLLFLSGRHCWRRLEGHAIEGRRPRRLSERESGVTRPRCVHQSAIISERMPTMTLKNSMKSTQRSTPAIPIRLFGRLRPPPALRLSGIRSRWRMSREKRLANWTFSSGEGNGLQRAARRVGKKRGEEIRLRWWMIVWEMLRAASFRWALGYLPIK